LIQKSKVKRREKRQRGEYSCRDGGTSEVSAVALAVGIATAFERTREGLQ